jgi:hypothetical protein
MTRTVDADIVLAALHQIEDHLSSPHANGALRASNGRHGVRSLIQQIENVAADHADGGVAEAAWNAGVAAADRYEEYDAEWRAARNPYRVTHESSDPDHTNGSGDD